MSAILTLAQNGFRESRRNRVTVVVFAFAFAMIFLATFALEFTVATFQRVLTDVGLGVMSLIAAVLAIFLGSSLIPKEIERRTIFLIVSKPIRRSSFVIGRLLGNLFTVYAVVVLMTALFAAQIVLQGAPITGPLVTAMVGVLLEVTVVSALCFAFASWTSQMVTAVATIGLYFVGHMASDLYKFADRAKDAPVRVLGKALYYLLPNLDRLDFKARATYGDPTSLAELGQALVYALGYSTVLVVIACVLFERRDFK